MIHPYNGAVPKLCVILLLLIGLPAYAHADVPGVTVTLAGGEVVGKTRGLGSASVTAQVTNSTGRTLEGIRLAAWYSPVDVLPPADATWRIHEFVFDPPLADGASGSLQFTDDGAAQYVLLDAQQVKYVPAVRYNGATTDLRFPVLRDGPTVYIALRDFADITGGSLSGNGGSFLIERASRRIELRSGSAQAHLDGKPVALKAAVIESSGRTYLALDDAAALLGLSAADDGDDLYELK